MSSGELSHERCIADMLELLDMLGAPRAVVGGMSLGGFLSLLFCARHPERVAALLLVDTGPGFRDDAARGAWNAWVEGLADDLDARGLAALSSESGVRGRGARGGRSGLGHGGARHSDAARRGGRSVAGPDRGAHVDRRGRATTIGFSRRRTPWLAAFPAQARYVIEDAGHAANMDQPAEFNRAVREFLGDM